MRPIPRTPLPGGETIPVLGLGTYRMGEEPRKRKSEIAALRVGMDLGMTVIDTAEMYADGGAEEVVGEAIGRRRDDVFVVTKFYPHNATRQKMVAACERSLRRLGTDRIDLYLLHWRGEVPLRQTMDGFDELLRTEKIRYAGVSNFDVSDMEEVMRLKDGARIVADQVLYNLVRRSIESGLMGWARKRRRPLIAYSPLEEGLLSHSRHPALAAVAERHGATAAQVALAWVIREPGIVAIPKAAREADVREDRGATEVKLTKADLDELDGSFPPPGEKIPLETR